MALKMNSLLGLVFVMYGAYGQSDIWDTEKPVEYGTTTLAPRTPCTVRGEAGYCVESLLYCRTPHHGQETITWRSSNPCPNGVCCKRSDVIDTTSSSSTSSSTTISSTSSTTSSTTSATTNTRPPVTQGCGIRNENGVFYRGGTDVKQARFGEFPWTIAVYKVLKNGNEEYSCVGSLIHPRVVLTVASRFDRGGKFRVRAGDWNLSSKQERLKRQDREVESIVIHESFNSGSGTYDAGLLFLDRAINPERHINYACLPNPNQVTPPSTTCFVTGWGRVNVNEPLQDTEKLVEVPVVDRNICQTKLRASLDNEDYNLSSAMMCAGGKGEDVCQGDGGGPLVCPYPGQNVRYYQAGIVSWGVDCNTPDLPGVYNDVAHLRSWIDKHVQAKGYSTNYYTP